MRCPNCNWDNDDQNERCESCNAPLYYPSGGKSDAAFKKTIRDIPKEGKGFPTILPKEEPDAPMEPTTPKSGPSPTGTGTIPPWALFGNSRSGFCKLTPLPSSPNDRNLPNEINLKGDHAELNRGNLDPNNVTISQKLQAVMTKKNGKWYIKDQSTYKTTYILASEDVALKDGDVILMGNRRFVFTEE